MRRRPRPLLVCPEPGCDVELISQESPKNRYNPRIFKFKPNGARCGHWPGNENRGGEESVQHDWMKLNLAKMARRFGYTATPEHWPTRADVFVHEPGYSLEVQLRQTDFEGRTRARNGRVCWFLPGGINQPSVQSALREQPVVRFRFIDRLSRRPTAPWERQDDPTILDRTFLEVFGTVAASRRTRPDPGAEPEIWFDTESMDGYLFLKQILGGRRAWYAPGALRRDRGVWALDEDVTTYRRYRQAEGRNRHRRTPAPTAPAANAPPPRVNLSASDVNIPCSSAQPAIPTIPASASQSESPSTGHEQPHEQQTIPPEPTPARQASRVPVQKRRWWMFWRRWHDDRST